MQFADVACAIKFSWQPPLVTKNWTLCIPYTTLSHSSCLWYTVYVQKSTFYSQSFYENDFSDGLCAIGCMPCFSWWRSSWTEMPDFSRRIIFFPFSRKGTRTSAWPLKKQDRPVTISNIPCCWQSSTLWRKGLAPYAHFHVAYPWKRGREQIL